jgi:acetyltransferase-like isoleucine patch superfamily enzyme
MQALTIQKKGDVLLVSNLSDKAVVQTKNIGSNVTVHEFSIIRPEVVIGDNVVIHPNVVIENGVIINDNVEIFPGTYIGKIPKGAGALAREPIYDKFIEIGAGCCLGANSVIYYDVRIGNNTLIGDGASIREKCIIGSKCIISRYVTLNYFVTIGNNTKIMDLTHITGKCSIGNDVFIGMLVSTANDNSIGKEEYVESNIQGPNIADHVTIGQGALILPNVNIGKKSIIGANSVVTKDIPANAVAMGTPAKIIRYIE